MEGYCPQCGEYEKRFSEGVCERCCEENQRALDQHNAAFDAWEKLTDEQRADRVRRASH